VADFAVRIGGPPAPDDTITSSNPYNQHSSTKVVGSQPLPTAAQKPIPSGVALILDYGPLSTVPINSLRGIQAHKRVSPFVCPGTVDISADVDFVALAEAALNASPGVEVHGPMEQGTWLELMGIRERAAQLLKKMSEPDGGNSQKGIETALARLTEKTANGMGGIYKVMAIVPERSGKMPVGFGGTIGG
jgi:NADH dehydrogenase [ubiquinone] 1 alpha subcomplex assembly factor 7